MKKVRHGKYLAIRVPFEILSGEKLTLVFKGPGFDKKTIRCLVRRHENVESGTAVLLENNNLQNLFSIQEESKQSDVLTLGTEVILDIEMDPATPAESSSGVKKNIGKSVNVGDSKTLAENIDQLIGRIRNQTVFELFEKGKGTSSSEVHERFLAMAYSVHPDRVLVGKDINMHREATEALAELNGAYQQFLKYEENANENDLFSVPEEGWLVSLDDTGAVHTPLPLWSVDSKSLFSEDGVEFSYTKVTKHIGQGRLQAASELLQACLQENPSHEQARALMHVVQGVELVMENAKDEALLHFEAALTIDPSCSLAKAKANEHHLPLKAHKPRA